jgi:glutathione S-transferase
MKLYITPGSPYARIARAVMLEKGLQDRVEIVEAQTRSANSPYYKINPSGRVPYLVRDDGPAFEESALICAYFDSLDGKPMFALPTGNEGWEARRLEGLARSMLDGLAVWSRELRRPPDERSPTIIDHESARAMRMADLWEGEIGHRLMNVTLNMAQITLACALGYGSRNPGFVWRPGHTKLCAWYDRIASRPSLAATAPPARP